MRPGLPWVACRQYVTKHEECEGSPTQHWTSVTFGLSTVSNFGLSPISPVPELATHTHSCARCLACGTCHPHLLLCTLPSMREGCADVDTQDAADASSTVSLCRQAAQSWLLSRRPSTRHESAVSECLWKKET